MLAVDAGGRRITWPSSVLRVADSASVLGVLTSPAQVLATRRLDYWKRDERARESPCAYRERSVRGLVWAVVMAR